MREPPNPILINLMVGLIVGAIFVAWETVKEMLERNKPTIQAYIGRHDERAWIYVRYTTIGLIILSVLIIIGLASAIFG